MSNIITLNSGLIERKKVETLNAQSLRKTIPFSEINLVNDTTIEFKDARLQITKDSFKQLLRLIGMSQSFANSFEQLFSNETKTNFINRVKDAMSSNSGKLNEVTLIVNPATKMVVGITKASNELISNERFLNVVDRIIDQNSLDVTDWSVDPTKGIVNINAFNNKAEFSVSGLSDEVFKGGITFRNSPNGGFQVMPYVNRLWCTNGMTSPVAQEAITLNSLDSSTMEKFFEQLNDLRQRNFAPQGFADIVRSAANTRASLNEMRQAYNQISSHIGEKAEHWVPFQENLNAYAKRGLEGMTIDQMRGAKSNQSIWSVVNGLTHFATHGTDLITSNVQDYQNANMMVAAGRILGNGQYDHSNHMPDAFNENVLDTMPQLGVILN